MNAWCAETSTFPGDSKITSCNKLASGRRSRGVYGGDDRLRAGHNRLHQRRACVHDLLEIRLPTIRVAATSRQFLDVMPGAEYRSVGGNDDNPRGLVRAKVNDGICQFCQHGLRQTIALHRTIERKRRDIVLSFAEQDRFIGSIRWFSLKLMCVGHSSHLGLVKS